MYTLNMTRNANDTDHCVRWRCLTLGFCHLWRWRIVVWTWCCVRSVSPTAGDPWSAARPWLETITRTTELNPRRWRTNIREDLQDDASTVPTAIGLGAWRAFGTRRRAATGRQSYLQTAKGTTLARALGDKTRIMRQSTDNYSYGIQCLNFLLQFSRLSLITVNTVEVAPANRMLQVFIYPGFPLITTDNIDHGRVITAEGYPGRGA